MLWYIYCKHCVYIDINTFFCTLFRITYRLIVLPYGYLKSSILGAFGAFFNHTIGALEKRWLALLKPSVTILRQKYWQKPPFLISFLNNAQFFKLQGRFLPGSEIERSKKVRQSRCLLTVKTNRY